LLWLGREKGGGAELEDLSGNLIVQLGLVTEASIGIGSSSGVPLAKFDGDVKQYRTTQRERRSDLFV
jgi:hypothetical protein